MDSSTKTKIFDPDGDLTLILNLTLESNDPSEQSRDGEIRMLVSSKHMTLVSPIFKAMLRHSTFEEGQTLSITGKVEIPLPDDDPEALTVLLDIIHGRGSKVPSNVSLDLLTRLAVLVDKYGLCEAIVLASDAWIYGLSFKSFPMDDTLKGKLLEWTAISWAFENAKEFMRATRLAILGEGEDFTKAAVVTTLPVPQSVLTALEKARQNAMRDCFEVVDTLVEKYIRQPEEIEGCPTSLCRVQGHPGRAVACDTMVLGSLIKEASALNLWPPPQLPYEQGSVLGLMSRIRILRVSSMCGNKSLSHCLEYGMDHGIAKQINESMQKIEEGVNGLNLRDFKAKTASRPYI